MATARSTKAYCRAVDSMCSATCWGWDCRTYTIACRHRWWSWSFGDTSPRGLRVGSIIGHLLLGKKTVPCDDPRHDLTQTPTLLRRQRDPELRQRYLLRALGWGGAEASRWGGPLSGLNIRHLLADRRADVDTTGTASAGLRY